MEDYLMLYSPGLAGIHPASSKCALWMSKALRSLPARCYKCLTDQYSGFIVVL